MYTKVTIEYMDYILGDRILNAFIIKKDMA